MRSCARAEVAFAAEHLGHSTTTKLKLYRDGTPEDRRAGVRRAVLGALPGTSVG